MLELETPGRSVLMASDGVGQSPSAIAFNAPVNNATQTTTYEKTERMVSVNYSPLE